MEVYIESTRKNLKYDPPIQNTAKTAILIHKEGLQMISLKKNSEF